MTTWLESFLCDFFVPKGFNPYVGGLMYEATEPYIAAGFPSDCSLRIFILGERGDTSL